MEGIRIQSQTGRSEPASAVHRAVSTADRLANLVRRHGFAGDYPWTLHFVWKLLHNDPGTLSLIANNPFPNAPPHYIRARLYRYQFAPLGDKAWWKRELIGEWLPGAFDRRYAIPAYSRGDGLARLAQDRHLTVRALLIARMFRASCDNRNVPAEREAVRSRAISDGLPRCPPGRDDQIEIAGNNKTRGPRCTAADYAWAS